MTTYNPEKSTQRIRVLVLFGGRSGEHPVSIVTAVGVLEALDPQRYEVIPVGITPNGTWNAVSAGEGPWTVNKLIGSATEQTSGSTLGETLPEVPEPDHPVALHRGPSGAQLVDASTGDVLKDIDIAFPLLHGPFGEDGTVQGLFETLELPYVGPGVLASAVGMDKHFMKIAFTAAGLKVGDWVTITDRMWNQDRVGALESCQRLSYPVFVKPARGGSSLGITRVDHARDLEDAVEEARRFDPKVIVEAGIEGREIECAVLDGRNGGPARASYPGEIEVHADDSGHQFYDFRAKYQDSTAAELTCPARLSEEAIQQVRELALVAFDSVDAAGLSRVDFFYTPAGEFIVNEINTMPGFTPISMYPAMWQRTGMDYPELVEELVLLGLERGTGLH